MQPDTAPIRPGEELDLRALSLFLRERIPGAEQDVELEQFPGGHSNLTYLVRCGGYEYVLRRPPMGPVALKAHDMAREFRFLAAVHPHFPPAPRPILLCEDPSIAGATFFLMERRRGVIVRENVEEARADKVSQAFLNCLVQLHSIDIQREGLAGLGKPEGFLKRQVNGWTERWEHAATELMPDVEAVLPWLAANLPESPAATIIHNDYKLDNLMLKSNDYSQVAALLDWEMATVGDPLLDLGVALTYWTHAGMPDQDGNLSSPFTAGWMDRDFIAECYSITTGRSVDRLAYYEVFGVFKLLVIIQQIYYRWLKGQTQDARFAHFGGMVKHLAWTATQLAEKAG